LKNNLKTWCESEKHSEVFEEFIKGLKNE